MTRHFSITVLLLSFFNLCTSQSNFKKEDLQTIKRYPPIVQKIESPSTFLYKSKNNVTLSFRLQAEQVLDEDYENDPDRYINGEFYGDGSKTISHLNGTFTIGKTQYKLYGAYVAEGNLEGVVYDNKNNPFGILSWELGNNITATLQTKDKDYSYNLNSVEAPKPTRASSNALQKILNPDSVTVKKEQDITTMEDIVTVLTVSDFLTLFSVDDSEQTNLLQNSGWRYIKAEETPKNNTMVQCIMFKNNGKKIEDAQVLNRWTILNNDTGLTTNLLELCVYDLKYVEKFISELKFYNFKLVEKTKKNYKFRNADHYLLIEEVLLKKDKVVYKIKIG